jgi:hypothetical protein
LLSVHIILFYNALSGINIRYNIPITNGKELSLDVGEICKENFNVTLRKKLQIKKTGNVYCLVQKLSEMENVHIPWDSVIIGFYDYLFLS